MCGQRLVLLAEKAIYWLDEDILLVADVHLGKVQHFRQAGIGVPAIAGQLNFDKIQMLVHKFEAKRLIFLGDLFHSRYNKDWEQFRALTSRNNKTSFELVVGNHDILPKMTFDQVFDQIHTEGIALGPFYLTHIPKVKDGYYTLAGHLHPAIRLSAPALKSLRLPCFHFQQQIGILPAFGEFTGMSLIKKKKEDSVYGIYEDKIIEV